MPNTKSAKKRMRQSAGRRTRNRIQRATLRNVLRKVGAATSVEDARSAYLNAEKLLDRAAGNHLIHLNKAARYKSRLQAFIANLSE